MLGVTTVGLGRDGDREVCQSSLKASGLPARFWWDIGQDGKPGPIQTAWNARIDLYVLDHRGVIRYKHVFQPELFEKAVDASKDRRTSWSQKGEWKLNIVRID